MLPRPDAYRQCKRLNLSQLAPIGAIWLANGEHRRRTALATRLSSGVRLVTLNLTDCHPERGCAGYVSGRGRPEQGTSESKDPYSRSTRGLNTDMARIVIRLAAGIDKTAHTIANCKPRMP